MRHRESERDDQEHANPFEELRYDLRGIRVWLEEIQPIYLRGVAITGATYLERESANLLKAFFIDDTALADELLSGFGPLATFDACIETTFALGLISEQERRNLQLIRKIRNSFAHMPGEVSFQTPEIRDRCMELQPPPAFAGLFDADNDDPHGRFVNTLSFLVLVLIIRRENITHQDRVDSLTRDDIETRIREAGEVEE